MALETLAASATAWVWKTYGKALVDGYLDMAREEWTKVQWPKAADQYRQKMADLYGTLRVLGNPEPVPLADVFTDVFILEKPQALRRFDIEQLKEDPIKLESERISGLRLISQKDRKRLFILGKPGAGKTTFLKHIALLAVQGKLNQIPIFISLKEWSDSGHDLMTFIAEQFDICNFPQAEPFVETILKAGAAIVLFDGLDEIRQEDDRRAKAITDLNNFSKKYNDCQCLITCRNAATTHAFEHFTYVEMADFDDKQLETYVRKWFKDSSAKRDAFLEDIQKETHRGLRELGRVPLLLSMLCLAFDETMSFPERRVEIYEEALDALLKKWDSSRSIRRDQIYRKLSLGHKRQLFAQLAAETFEKGDYFLRQDDLERKIASYLKTLPPSDDTEDIDGERVLEDIEVQHAILIKRAHRVYSFAHLSFQEYFTAKYIVEHQIDGTIERLIDNYLTDDRWREVFLLSASLLPNADRFFAYFRQALDRLIIREEILLELLRQIAPLHPVSRRAIGLAHALARDLIRDLIRVSALPLASVLTRVCALPLASDLARYHLPAELLELGLASELGSDSIRKFASLLDRTLDLDYDLDFDFNLTHELMMSYLNATHLLLDCLVLARVSDRAAIEESLLLPPQATGEEG